jgi:hypothetical protein
MINMSEATSIPAASYSPSDGIGADLTTMSAETLLDYCQMQLGGMDTQINAQMSAQQTALREREAVQSAQTALEQFGTDGPQGAPQMHTCVTAIDQAIAQLPQNDPVAAQLTDFRSQLLKQYQYQPPGAFIQPQQSQPSSDGAIDILTGFAGTESRALESVDEATRADGVLGRAPDPNTKEWQGTTDALANIADDIKSNADIQMLQLQDLVSQRQQAVQLCSGMMSKTDQTLEDQAKAVGQ